MPCGPRRHDSDRRRQRGRSSGRRPGAPRGLAPPLVAECPVNLECTLLGVDQIGDHDMFRPEALVQHVDENVPDESGRIRVEKPDGLCYMLGEHWSPGACLGRQGFTNT